jgi:hypothetical protein
MPGAETLKSFDPRRLFPKSARLKDFNLPGLIAAL